MASVRAGVDVHDVFREVYERVSMAGIVLILLLMYIALHNDFSGTPR